MTYRLRNITIAVGLAVLAAMLTSFYVRQEKQNLQEGQTLATVWVAQEDIAPGTSGEEVSRLMDEAKVAKSSVAPGAVVAPEDLAGLVSTEKIYAGEQVTELRFRTPTQQGVRAELTGNLRAVQIPGDSNQLLHGTLKEGDRVDVVGSWAVKIEDKDKKISRVVLRDILVLRAPEATFDNGKLQESQGDKSVMLALTDAQTQKLWWLVTTGSWTLDLRPTEDPADSPESFEHEGTMVGDGLTRAQFLRILNSPF